MRMRSKKGSSSAPPGFALCNPNEQNVHTTYMDEQGPKVQELFSMNKKTDTSSWQTVALKQLIDSNKEGFFVTDLAQLQELISNLLSQLQQGADITIPFIKQIISLSVIPFRKISNGDDVRCFPHIGGFFASLCPVLNLPYQDLQIETAKAIYWFSQNCGPLTTSESSTFHYFYPITNANALYCNIPKQLNVESVIHIFCENLTAYLQTVSDDPNNTDILTLCFNSLFEFVKRGQAKHIPASFLSTLLEFVMTKSDFRAEITTNQVDQMTSKSERSSSTSAKQSVCTVRVLSFALLFIDAYIQESADGMQICITTLPTLWNFFVDTFFSCFKNVQKSLRNEILGIIILTMHSCSLHSVEKTLTSKMFDLLQSISQLPLDNAADITYKESRKIRLTHESVDIELILLSQDLLLSLHESQDLPEARPDFIEHQICVLKGEINKYLIPSQNEFTLHALQLLHAFVVNIDHFSENGGFTVIMSIIDHPTSDPLLFYTLLLALKLHTVFETKETIESLMALPHENEHILSLVLSMLAILMEGNESLTQHFVSRQGIDLLKQCFTSKTTEVVTASVDCARSIAPFCLTDIDQRFVFMLLDCADTASTLLRYDFVGLFLDLLQYETFISSALLWRSLTTNSNIQRTIVRWWKQEESRLHIKYDHCIIINREKPLEGHTFNEISNETTQNSNSNANARTFVPHPPLYSDEKANTNDWLLDSQSLLPPKKTYKLDFRARLFLMLNAFPPLESTDCKPSDRIKELMIRSYKELKTGSVWSDIREQLKNEQVKPLHEDKIMIERKIEEMCSLSDNIFKQQEMIWKQYENDSLALEQRTYNQLNDGIKTAQYVAENYNAIINSQPVTVARSFQGRTVKGEDVLVSTGNLRNMAKQEIHMSSTDDNANASQQQEKELEESYINDCLKDESISYLVQLMKNTQSNSQTMTLSSDVPSQTQTPSNIQQNKSGSITPPQ